MPKFNTTTADYVPYGGHVISGSDPNRYKFTGKERDTESGLDDFDARFYSSPFGRFVARPNPAPERKRGWSKSETTPALLRRFWASRTCVLRMFLLLGGNRAVYQNRRDGGIVGFGSGLTRNASARQLDNVISENIP
jgi:RHS repeat-associated protein